MNEQPKKIPILYKEEVKFDFPNIRHLRVHQCLSPWPPGSGEMCETKLPATFLAGPVNHVLVLWSHLAEMAGSRLVSAMPFQKFYKAKARKPIC
jgi:hypothetical protein